MYINLVKSKIFVVFNTAIKSDFYPRIVNPEGVTYDNQENFKILGINLSTHKRKGIDFNQYIDKCIQKAYSNIWILRRLAEMGVPTEKLILTYTLRVRVHIEQNTPLFMFLLTKAMEKKIFE